MKAQSTSKRVYRGRRREAYSVLERIGASLVMAAELRRRARVTDDKWSRKALRYGAQWHIEHAWRLAIDYEIEPEAMPRYMPLRSWR
jgi:hypothetical protein